MSNPVSEQPDHVPRWRSMSPQELEREYSPSSAVGGDYAPFVHQYLVRSNAARAACHRIETLTYGSRQANSIDIALPEQPEGCPLILFVHGGYWQALSKRDSFFGADRFTARGIAYAAVDYTLAPAASLTEMVAECRAALACMLATSDSFGIDANRIFLAGSSAGAHLCAMCCCDETLERRIAGAILLSGIYELEPFVAISDNEVVGMSIAEARRNSPVLLYTTSFPRTIITWGEHETAEFKRQSLALGNKLQESARSVQVFESSARNHFDVVHDMADSNTRLGQSVLELVL